jgi:flagellar FliL protein
MFKKKPKGAEAPATDSETPAAAGADGETLAIEGDGPRKKGLPLKMLIIAGAAAVLVLGGGGTGAFMLLGHKTDKAGDHKPKPKKPKKGGEGGEGGAKADKNAAQITDGPDGVVFYTLPDLVVNMQTADGKPTFLKLKLTFELPDHETADVLEPNRPRLQDMFTTFLRELRPEDLAGSQGSYQLRLEVLRRVNLVIAPAKINAVLIEEMLVN